MLRWRREVVLRKWKGRERYKSYRGNLLIAPRWYLISPRWLCLRTAVRETRYISSMRRVLFWNADHADLRGCLRHNDCMSDISKKPLPVQEGRGFFVCRCLCSSCVCYCFISTFTVLSPILTIATEPNMRDVFSDATPVVAMTESCCTPFAP